MAEIQDIKEGAKFLTPKNSDGKGRIGTAYAVSERKKELGIVDLQFDGAGCVVAGNDYMPPSSQMNVKFLTLVK